MEEYPTHLSGDPKKRIERAGKEAVKYACLSDEELVGLVGLASGNIVREAASAEIQRRMVKAVRDFSDSSKRQSSWMIRLTWAIIVLTVVLAIIAGLQLWTMLTLGK